MKAICASVNLDLFMVLPRPTARIAHAAKLEFSSKDRSENREAGQPGWQVPGTDLNCSESTGWRGHRAAGVRRDRSRQPRAASPGSGTAICAGTDADSGILSGT